LIQINSKKRPFKYPVSLYAQKTAASNNKAQIYKKDTCVHDIKRHT